MKTFDNPLSSLGAHMPCTNGHVPDVVIFTKVIIVKQSWRMLYFAIYNARTTVVYKTLSKARVAVIGHVMRAEYSLPALT